MGYFIEMSLAFAEPLAAILLYVAITAAWLAPERGLSCTSLQVDGAQRARAHQKKRWSAVSITGGPCTVDLVPYTTNSCELPI